MRPLSTRLVALLRASLPVDLAPQSGADLDWARLAEIADAICTSSPQPRAAARALAARTFASNPNLDSDLGKSVLAIYEHACHALIPDWAAGLDAHVEADAAGGVRVWLRFADAVFDADTLHSPAMDSLFEVLAGFADQIPALVGEPPGDGELQRWPGQAIATIHFQPRERAQQPTPDTGGIAALGELIDGIVEISSDCRIYKTNESALRRLGLTREHVLSRTLDELVAARDRPRILEQVAKAFTTERASFVSFRSFDTRGQYLDVEASISPFRRADGTQRAVAVLREVTSRVAREQAALDLARRYQTMVEAGQDIALELGEDGRTTYAHLSVPGFESIPRNKRFANALFERLDADSKTTASDGYHSAAQQDGSQHFDVKLRTDSGALRWFSVRVQSLGDRRGMAARMWDITHRKEYEDALRAIAETAFESGAFLDSLVGHMARALGFECALVATHGDGSTPVAQTLALWNEGGLGDETEFSVTGTPFEAVLAGQTRIFAEGLGRCFAEPTRLGQPGDGPNFEAFVGAPLYDVRGNVAGCIAAMSTRPIANPDLARSTLAIFAQRASAELQRAAASFTQLETEERLSTILEQSHELIIDADSVRGVEYVSPSVRKILGLGPRDLALKELLADDERDEIIRRFSAAFTQADPVQELVRVRDREHGWHWLDVTARSYDGKNGDRRLLVIGRDITHEHLAEREREQLTGLMQRSSDLMTLCSLGGEVLFLNEAGKRLLGIHRDAPSTSLFDFFASEHDAQLRNEIISILAREKSWIGELDLRHVESGEVIPVSASLFIMSDERTSRPAALAVICHDLRDQQRAALALGEATARLALLAESSYDLVCEVDERGMFVSVSPTYETILGFDRADLVGTRALALIPTAEHPHVRTSFKEVIANGGGRVGRTTCLDAEGNARPVEATLVAYASASGRTHALIVMRDLTERSEAEQKLHESEERLRQSQKMEAVGRLAGGIAHDFNNLLTAITGHADLLVGDLGEDHPSLPDVHEILSASTRAAGLTRQLLAFSRRQVLQFQAVDLNRLVSGIDSMLRRVIGEEFRYVSALEGNLWPAIADEGQIEQVILNMVVNARDAMPGGGEILVETCNVTLTEDGAGSLGVIPAGDYTSLSVSDTGTGLDHETLEHIFEPFFTTKPRGQGTGLGLSTVLGIVQQSGGHLQVETRVGSGSLFRVLLPRTPEPIAQLGAEHEPETEFAAARGSAVVLLLEDQVAVRTLVSRHLSDQGYEVLVASNGEAALELCRLRDDIDLLLADVVLPGLDGPTVAALVRESHPTIRVAFMSGFADDALPRHEVGSVDPGNDSLLHKPFTRQALLRCVEEALSDER